ncbi:MAG TPA: hypothetical protein VMW64_09885 [Dehalococcoidia bacterium]|nr:hypothetical protein [Dehalococcoidia bacterium]
MSYVYTHLPEDRDIGFDGRSYSIKEGILEYRGRKLLYLNAEASAVSFCDRSYAYHLGSVNVKGYVVRWKFGANERGEMLSEIQTISDEMEKQEITKLLRAEQTVSAVYFF